MTPPNRWVLALLVVAACAASPPPAASRAPAPPPPPPPRPPPANACQAALIALTEGRIDAWGGTSTCTRADVDRMFGRTGAPDQHSVFGPSQEYARRGVSRGPILVAFRNDEPVVIAFHYPALPTPVEALLGPPEAKLRTRSVIEQHLWPARGIALHVDPYAEPRDRVVTVLAFPAMTLARYEASLSWALKYDEETDGR